jgi:hypothetical protein
MVSLEEYLNPRRACLWKNFKALDHTPQQQMDYFPATNNTTELLDLSHPSESQQATSLRNAQMSQFLRLPAEIRERVFSYLLGGESIHVMLGPPKNKHYYVAEESRYRLDICSRTEAFTEVDPSTPRARELMAKTPNEDPPFTRRHVRCCIKPSQYSVHQALDLDLLLTCRQIYREACLLPFKNNTFVVEFGLGRENSLPPSVNVLEALIGSLAPEQRRAITHLVLASRVFNRSDAVQIERLRGLVSLQVIHTHLFGHEDADRWPTDDTFTWEHWSHHVNMPVLKHVRHTAELQPGCHDCLKGCWDQERIDDIDKTLRGWEVELLERVRESRKPVEPVTSEVEKVARLERHGSSCSWIDEEYDEDDEDDEDWKESDGSCDFWKLCPGVEELQRLGEIRLHLPRDGMRAREALWYVISGMGRRGSRL